MLTGIELDDDTLASRKMVDEVSIMIKEGMLDKIDKSRISCGLDKPLTIGIIHIIKGITTIAEVTIQAC